MTTPLAHDRADVLDHGHVVERGRELPEQLLGRGRPQLHDQLHGRPVAVDVAPLVITASSASVTYGTGPPTITPSYSGFVNGDNASSLTTAPDVLHHGHRRQPGGHLRHVVLGSRRPQLLDQLRRRRGDGHPRAPHHHGVVGHGRPTAARPRRSRPIVTGLQNGESTTVLGAGLTCSTAATASSSVGTYATTCSGAVDPNYAITYVAGTTTVIPAPLTITASSGTMTYGGAVPVIIADRLGAPERREPAVLGAGLACTTTATPDELGGELPEQLLGRRRRQLHHQLRGRHRQRHPGGAYRSRRRRTA